MIEEIKAYKASDGKIFEQSEQFEAIEHEARIKLTECIGPRCTVEIMQKVLDVYAAIAPLYSAVMERKEYGGRKNA